MRVNAGESPHIAYAVAVDVNGDEPLYFGDPNYITCFRSSLKHFQSAITIKKGFTDLVSLSSKEIALMCASHSGEKIHHLPPFLCLQRWDTINRAWSAGHTHLMIETYIIRW